MGFTTPCFIRKNTPELRKKLEELGYRLFGEELNEDLCIFTSPECGLYNIEFLATFHIPKETDSIDCGTNEELFLAIAALRDDTDENQWFIMDVEIYVDIPKGTWFQSTDRNGGRHVGTQIEALYCHKATVEELIEHFKGKEE